MQPILRIAAGLLALFLGALLGALLGAQSVQAAGVVGNGTPASCTGNAFANRLSGGGLVTFNCGPAPHTIIVNTEVINANTTVDGGNRITLDGEDLRQIFIVQPGRTLTLRNIVLQKGNASQGGCLYISANATATATNVRFTQCLAQPGVGGAVFNAGTFNVAHSRFVGNSATGDAGIGQGRGGAIHNTGTLTADFTMFESNSARVHGGAIFNFRQATINDSRLESNTTATGGGGAIAVLRDITRADRVQINRSLFDGNSAATLGGGIYNMIGDVTVNNTTFGGNQANQGGAIYADGLTSTRLEFSTVFANRADSGGGFFINPGSAFTLTKSIVAGSRDRQNTSPQLNCDSGGGIYVTQGYNIIGDNSCFNPGLGTDLTATNPQLGALANNGGFSRTYLPNNGSPALNKVPKAQCVARDQRRFFRTATTCDIGAAERGAAQPLIWTPLVRR